MYNALFNKLYLYNTCTFIDFHQSINQSLEAHKITCVNHYVAGALPAGDIDISNGFWSPARLNDCVYNVTYAAE